jgi:transglutaminase-like putative cysteine protease
MIYDLTHVTAFEYDERVSVSHHVARMTPRAAPHQAVIEHAWAFDPAPALLREHRDVFGNVVAFFAVQQPHQRLSVTSRATVDVAGPVPLPAASPAWDAVRDALPEAPLEVCDFVAESPLLTAGAACAAYAAASFPAGRPIVEGVIDLTRRLHADLRFEAGVTSIATPVAEVLRQRAGVCQDFAHVQIACLRSLGLAARYVSGYLETSPPPGEPRLVGVDASHAWVSVYVPGHGWLDVDPTNDRVPADRHVTLAWGRDYSDVSPIRGVILGGGEQRTHVAVDLVRREAETTIP